MALKLVIFDLDGTLLEPALDFDAIKREIGLPADLPILEGLDTLTQAERVRANRILDRREEEAAARSRLMPGAEALLEWLRRRNVQIAVLTRNSRASVRRAEERHGLRFDAVVAREDKQPKPSPDGVRHLMEACGAGAGETVVMGDFRFDVEAGAAAGCRTIALVAAPRPPWAALATWQAGTLAEVRAILRRLAEGG
jgi:HAD superfamily hydrolase (TIGR01509 family)